MDIAFGNVSEKVHESNDLPNENQTAERYQKTSHPRQTFQTTSLERKAIRRSITKSIELKKEEGKIHYAETKKVESNLIPVLDLPTPAPRKSLIVLQDKCLDMKTKDQSYLPEIDGKYKSRVKCPIIFSIKSWDERSQETSRKHPEKVLLEYFPPLSSMFCGTKTVMYLQTYLL